MLLTYNALQKYMIKLRNKLETKSEFYPFSCFFFCTLFLCLQLLAFGVKIQAALFDFCSLGLQFRLRLALMFFLQPKEKSASPSSSKVASLLQI